MPVVRPSRLRNDANARYRERGEAGRSEPPEWYAKRVGWLTGATGGGRSGGAARQDGETLRQAIAAHSVVRCGYAPELAGEKTELAFAPSADVHLTGEVAARHRCVADISFDRRSRPGAISPHRETQHPATADGTPAALESRGPWPLPTLPLRLLQRVGMTVPRNLHHYVSEFPSLFRSGRQ
jgi:hypothetical protein